jgi:hypothetical protein
MSLAARLARYSAVSTSLALFSDKRLGKLVDEAHPMGSGIGGTSVLLEIDGTPVFVKRVALTDLERRPGNVMSTANMFELPTFCQYGVGGPGFGVWRELAANTMTTNWVLAKQSENFPLMYHWRVLPGAPPTPEEHADPERTVAYWDGSPAVQARLKAVSRSSASVVLFLEYIPQNLDDWLTAQATSDAEAIESAYVMVERDLRTAVGFMNSNGLLHFDAHFRNVLTDGQRLYVADLGLATSSRFELSEAELAFFDDHISHDGCYAVTQLLNSLVSTLTSVADWKERFELIRRYGDGEPGTLPPSAAAVVRRYAPIAVVMNEFYWKLHHDSRTTRYPVEEVRRVCTDASIFPT